MNTNIAEFDQAATQIAGLAKYQELFDSCAQLMAEALLADRKIFSIGTDIAALSAQQFSELLTHNPDQPRPPLPAIFLPGKPGCSEHFSALGQEGDFAIFFCGPEALTPLDDLLDVCLQRNLTSVLISPDHDHLEATDKALEIRLEYRSLADHMTNLSAVCNYLTKSIEKQLFGRQPNA